MTTTYQLKTFADLYTAICEEAGISASDTTDVARVKRAINIVYANVTGRKNWYWLNRTIDLTLPAYVSSGTASVTQNSASVTLTVAPASSKTGYWFAIDGYNETYRIESHSANSTTVNLGNIFTGATNATATYKIWTERLPLPTDCKETVEVWHDNFRKPCDNLGRQEFRRIWSLQPRNEGYPAYYFTGDYSNPNPTSSITSLPAIATRASAGTRKTIVFASGLPAAVTTPVSAGAPVVWNVASAGHPSYNGHIYISSVSTTTSTNDTVTYTGASEYTESAVADSAMTITAVNTNSEYDRYRELYLYPALSRTPVTLHCEYTRQFVPLTEDTDEPFMPIQDRDILYYGGLWKTWKRKRNDGETTLSKKDFDDKLKDMESKFQDSTENARLEPSKNYLGAKRNMWRRRAVDSDFSGSIGGSGAGQTITGTASRAAQFGADGVLVASSTVSTTELGYIDGVTSNVQTQLDTKMTNALTSGYIFVGNSSNVATGVPVSGDVTITTAGDVELAAGAIVNADVNASAAIAYSKLNLATSIVNADVSASAAIVDTKLATISTASKVSNSATTATSANTASAIVSRDGSGNFTAGTITAALTGAASGNLSATASNHGILVSGAANVATVVAPNASTVFPLISGGASADPAWAALGPTGGGTGLTTYTTGDVPYASATNTLSKLAIGTSGQFLKTINGIPGWGPGANGINYLTSNPDAETDTTGWTTYADAAGTSPVDGTGGAPTVTWTRTTSTPLRGTGSFLNTKDAANRQGNGVSFAITLDSADQAKPIMVSFDYAVASGTYADGDLTVYLYDVTNALVIQPAPYQILSAAAGLSQKWTGYFQTSAASTSYRLCIHTASTSASAYTVKFDNFNVGPTYQSYGAVQTDWTAFTPTGAWVANTTYTGFYRRHGDSIDIQYQLALAGAPTTATLTLNTPSGVTIDTTKLTSNNTFQQYGFIRGISAGNSFVGNVSLNNSTSFVGTYTLDGATASIMKAGNITQAAPYTFANADHVEITLYDLPVSGWSSNVQVSSDADTRVVAARYYRSSAQSIGNGTEDIVNFDTKVYDTHNAVTTGASWKFTAPVPGYYKVHESLSYAANVGGATRGAIFYKNNATRTAFTALRQPSGTFSASASYHQASDIIYLNAGDYIDGRAYQDSGGALNLTGTSDESYITIERMTGPAQIAASESVSARYTNTAGTTLTKSASTIVPFATKDYDTHGAWVTDTFTAPMAGKYAVKSTIMLAAGATWASGDQIELDVYKNGAIHTGNISTIFFGTYSQVIGAQVSATVNCVQGDTIKINAVPTKAAAGNLTLSTSAGYNCIAIERVGN